jgi:enoyl-CoA hydratase
MPDVEIDRQGPVATVILDRPEVRNAVDPPTAEALGRAFRELDADPQVAAMVLWGAGGTFCAGADLRAVRAGWNPDRLQPPSGAPDDAFGPMGPTRLQLGKPVIAAVAGYALGGGCELAMMCDIVIAAQSARFGQPEIRLGIIPGAGGTQRLPRAVGKAKAMDLVLTARMMDAVEAERAGLVSRVVEDEKLIEEALGAAAAITRFSLPAVMMAKECINRAYEAPLGEGLLFERRLFHSLFATADQKEGMDAFLNKRKAAFKNR